MPHGIATPLVIIPGSVIDKSDTLDMGVKLSNTYLVRLIDNNIWKITLNVGILQLRAMAKSLNHYTRKFDQKEPV